MVYILTSEMVKFDGTDQGSLWAHTWPGIEIRGKPEFGDIKPLTTPQPNQLGDSLL